MVDDLQEESFEDKEQESKLPKDKVKKVFTWDKIVIDELGKKICGEIKTREAIFLNGLGSKVIIEKSDGEKLTKYYLPGTGFMSDQSAAMIFGLGKSKESVKLTLVSSTGERKESTLSFQE